MNFGYVTVNGVNSNVHRDGEICIIKILLTNAQKPVIVKNRFGVLLDRQALTGHKCYFLIFMGVSAFFDAFFAAKRGIIICQKVLISQKQGGYSDRSSLLDAIGLIMKSGKTVMNNIACTILGKGDKRT